MSELIKAKESNINIQESNSEYALNIVEDIVFNKYIKDMENLEIVPFTDDFLVNDFNNQTRIFKLDKIVYSKSEDIYSKMTNVLNTLSITESTVYMILDGDGIETNIYMGIKSNDPKREIYYISDMLESSLKGQLPGTEISNLENDEKQKLINGFSDNSIAMSTSIPSVKNEEINIQRLESFIDSMRGKKYTCIIMSDNAKKYEVDSIRSQYEEIYSTLSTLKEVTVSEGTNQARTIGTSYTTGVSTTISNTESKTESMGTSTSKSEMDALGKASKALAAAVTVGAGVLITAASAGTMAPLAVGAAAGLISSLGKQVTEGESQSFSTSNSESRSTGTTSSEGSSKSEQIGINMSKSTVIENKRIKNILEKIDKQFDRLNEFENLGMWKTSTYFLSEEIDVAEVAASNYNSLMRGNSSGIENMSINSWYNPDENLKKYIKNFMHPKFRYENNNEIIEVTGTSYMSGNELSILMGLPSRSVVGLPVIEYADFATEVIEVNKEENMINKFKIGCINNKGKNLKDIEVFLDKNSLSQHTFITGTTGSGKSNTVYKIIDEIKNKGKKYMIIEPAKGEYKNIFGNSKDVRVFGTNPKFADLLRINPFSFPENIHIYEHVDRLVEIFNATWDMYSAMPAILKEAIIRSYERCGWDLETSYSEYKVFPNFKDLEVNLEDVIKRSKYSEEVKGNYIGALLTRVSAMSNGLNKLIFNGEEIEHSVLFDENVIVDLSRLGSMETKSFIMGILIMKLNEYRMSNKCDLNSELKHVTIIEEAHNILPANISNSEGVSIGAKSVEMISNSLSEMRTYGEGFIIVDQSPSSVDISAIKNTNTKIIMRLPEENDIRISGKSIGLNDDQVKEIIRLPVGVAAIYQNGWLEPVLCKVDEYDGIEMEYSYVKMDNLEEKKFINLVKKRILEVLTGTYGYIKDEEIEELRYNSKVLNLSGEDHIYILKILDDLKIGNHTRLGIDFTRKCIIITNIFFNYDNNQIRKYQHSDRDMMKDIMLGLIEKIDEDFGQVNINFKKLLLQSIIKFNKESYGEDNCNLLMKILYNLE